MEMEKNEVLWVRYEQRIVVREESFEKVKPFLSLIYNEHFLLRSNIVNLIN